MGLACCLAHFFSMTCMSQVRGDNPQEAPSTGELHSNLQVSNREVFLKTTFGEDLNYRPRLSGADFAEFFARSVPFGPYVNSWGRAKRIYSQGGSLPKRWTEGRFIRNRLEVPTFRKTTAERQRMLTKP